MNKRSKLVTALLAFFLGGVGFHRFYLGNIFHGLVYLLLCWTFIPTILGVLEGIYFLILCEEDFDKIYNK